MINWNSIVGNFPPVIQYVIVIGILLILIYLCLVITRIAGKGHGKQITYDDPIEYDKQVPEMFGTYRKSKRRKNAEKEEDEQDSE